jgi:hypothetical protein
MLAHQGLPGELISLPATIQEKFRIHGLRIGRRRPEKVRGDRW